MRRVLALCAGVVAAVGYVVFCDRRQRANVDLGPVLNGDEFAAHLPHPWSTAPPGWNRP